MCWFMPMPGIHSHGAVRVEYYAERISKGGTNRHPTFTFEKNGPCSGILHADNAAGQVAAKMGMEHAIELAGKRRGRGRHPAHGPQRGHLLLRPAGRSRRAYRAFSVPVGPDGRAFGGAEIYYGTNPLAFSAPGEGDDIITFDMATTVQAWGKFSMPARAMKPFPTAGRWIKRRANQRSFAVHALLPTGPKGYGLMMMIDVLSGILLNLPFGRQVSSMYDNLSQGRELGQLHIVINPAFFSSSALFRQHISDTMRELNAITPAPGFNRFITRGRTGYQ